MGEKINSLIEKYPALFLDEGKRPICGVGCGDGWYDILDGLCHLLDDRVKNPPTKQRNRWLSWILVRLSNLMHHCGVSQILRFKLTDPIWDRFCTYVPIFVPPVKVSQVKEKFGSLRFYYQGGDEWCAGAVAMAEIATEKTCEYCGKPGKPTKDGWIKILCPDCHKERRGK